MRSPKALCMVFLALAMSVAFSACKKGADKRSDCKISDAAIGGGGGNIHITYNSDGSISRAAVGVGSVYSFSYHGDTVIVLNTDSGAFQSSTLYVNNAAGLATYARTEYDPAGTNWSEVKYEYNGVELSKATTTTSAGAGPDVNTFTWFNGNLAAQVSSSVSTIYDYYTDKPSQFGDYFSFFQAISGPVTVRNKNLVKSATGTAFNYSFGPDGKIVSLEIAGSNFVAVIDYTYQCN
ncbi:MAG: hypothetical protein Q8927_20195 [Bacteroidota bacterium]|nr:hypothetical protein [Bacteroidota bacterium]